MSQAVHTYQVLDDRLAISDSISFGVAVGGQSINQQTFNAQTKTASQVSLNILVPSLQTIIDRHLQLRTQFTIRLEGTCAGAGASLVNYPANFCFAPFPFSQLVNTLSVQINNTTTNSNYADNLNCMLRQMSPEGLMAYSDLSPTQLDYYGRNSEAGTLSPFKTIQEANDYLIPPRGAWVIDKVVNVANAGAGSAGSVEITITTTEPIFCSPFLFGDALQDSNCGMSGISSLNFNFNLGSVGRAILFKPLANGDVLTGATLKSIDACDMLMTFISPKPSQLIPLTCSLPYYELNSYKTQKGADAGVATGAPFSIQSSIVSPNCIPDKVYLQVRPAESTPQADALLPDFRFPIKNVSITWNTQSGLLASATQQDLYQMSKKAGLKMNYQSFTGKAGSTGAGNAMVGFTQLAGGIVCIDFNDALPIMEQYYSSSSLGQWTFSVNITCDNTTAGTLPACEAVITFFQSGVFQSTSGSSSQYIGVLSKEEVLRVSQEDPMLHSEHRRLVGGGLIPSWLGNAMKSGVSKLASKGIDYLKDNGAKLALGFAKKKLGESDNALAQMGSKAIASAGYGRPRVHH